MRVYTDRRERMSPAEVLARVTAPLERLLGTVSRVPLDEHEAATELLIEVGVLESALVDALHPDQDELDARERALRALSETAGRIFAASWQGVAPRTLVEEAREFERRLAGLPDAGSLGRVDGRFPEGYAWYGLHPETYLAAAATMHARRSPEEALCIGLRSIGTSLSAAVSAELARLGCRVESCTLRPRGDPFERTIRIGPRLGAWLRARADRPCLVVDEGPGLSGSSYASAVRALEELGFESNRIVLLPSWNADGSRLLSAAGRSCWTSHERFLVDFETVWLDSGRLFPGEGTTNDLSAGRWRNCVAGAEELPVQPHHERRKFLRRSQEHSGRLVLHKFSGLGRLGRSARDRAQRIAAAGFTPGPLGLAHGYLALPFVAGRPSTAADADVGLVDRIAEYLALIAREFSVEDPVACGDLLEMMRVNLSEALGERAASDACALGAGRARIEGGAAVALDARMLPHEWLRTGGVWIKTDCLDHHADHFFPGPHDIAWDLAATCCEFVLSDALRARLLGRFAELRPGERHLASRVAFHEAAWLAFRLGYAEEARSTLAGTDEARRWQVSAARCRQRLPAALARLEAQKGTH